MVDLHLPDVSQYQPKVDWASVAARNGGAAIVRAMYGSGEVDHAWDGGGRRRDARDKGIRALGLYQYLVASQDARAQAEAFVELVAPLVPGEFAVVDIEEGEGDQSSRAEEWLAVIDAKLGYAGYHGAWVYAPAWFFRDHGLMGFANSSRHTWVGAIADTAPVDVPHTLWQHTDREPWEGIGNCDCSIFVGTLDGLLARISS